MLGLPKSTKVNKQLPKKAIYAKFKMNTAAKERIDADITRIYIVNEVTAEKINLNDGTQIKSFFVMDVLLKRRDYDEKSIITLSKLIPQNMVMVLEYEDEAKIATYRSNKLLQTEWLAKGKCSVQLRGFDLDTVWENVIVQIGGLTVEQGNTVDEQISIDERRQKIEKEITKLEKQARTEKQPKKKFELVQQIRKLQLLLQSCK